MGNTEQLAMWRFWIPCTVQLASTTPRVGCGRHSSGPHVVADVDDDPTQIAGSSDNENTPTSTLASPSRSISPTTVSTNCLAVSISASPKRQSRRATRWPRASTALSEHDAAVGVRCLLEPDRERHRP